MMDNVLKDADGLKMTFLTLLTNQSEASAWIGRVLDSTMEVIMKVRLKKANGKHLVVLLLTLPLTLQSASIGASVTASMCGVHVWATTQAINEIEQTRKND